MSRAHSKYDWPHHIAQQKTSGLSVKEYSAQQGFSSWSFYVNRKKLSKPVLSQKKELPQITSSFFNLGTLQQRTSVLISFPDGTRVEINGQQSKEHLCSILKALRTKGGTRC
jgi:argininosuccinate synthase